ncbi:MAG TPA: hypothetical protein P5567_14800 [Kiritimatiellia bacterium]|nr:hypothetical protein [Kiritimatiellia bacterium]HRZ13710.1 hypothetical protein [Kiritimatiellia bacterium]HSA19382.1 hypothetical protein [Kiritimatiellia bacterium]
MGWILIASAVLAACGLMFLLMDWAERVLCADGRIALFTRVQLIENALVVGILGAIGWRRRLWRMETLARVPRSAWLALMCGVIPAVLYIASLRMPAWVPWFGEHGWLEGTTPILAIAAGSLFLCCAVRCRRKPPRDPAAVLAFAGLAAGAFFLAMEEIDWGQVVFCWPTPEAVFSQNFQNVTNLHNFFNAVFPALYEVTGWAVAGALILSVARVRRSIPWTGWRVLLPPLELAGLAGLVFLFRFWHEVFEQQFAWLLFFHAGMATGRAVSISTFPMTQGREGPR